MEIFDLYDKNRIKTGKVIERGKPVPRDAYRLVVHVCIFDGRGRMLIQRRKEDKASWPGYWDFSAGGSAIVGENSCEAAERETREELGLILDLSETMPCMTIYFSEGFDDVYGILCHADVERLTLQETEVSEVKWATEEAICAMIDSGSFIPYDKNMVRFLFARIESKELAISGRRKLN